MVKSQSESQVHKARLVLVDTGKHHPQRWKGLISDTTVPATSAASKETGAGVKRKSSFLSNRRSILQKEKKRTWFVWPGETRLEMRENYSV